MRGTFFIIFYGRNYFFECPKTNISSASLIIANYSLCKI